LVVLFPFGHSEHARVLKTEEYERHALTCLRLAQQAQDADSKAYLIEMAQAWIRMAGQVRGTDPLKKEPPES
jgi:hypothetical protein